jgi:uncharacterized membrane protein YedE/YeeE
MQRSWIVMSAAGAGVLFAVGLALGGMTDPARVQGFLDFSSTWDPALVWVMAGAVSVHWVLRRATLKSLPRPVFSDAFPQPTQTRIDRRLVVGASLFGAGWGLAGLCPGPALTALSTGAPSVGIFVAAFVLAMMAGHLIDRWRDQRTAGRAAFGLARAVHGLEPELTSEGNK